MSEPMNANLIPHPDLPNRKKLAIRLMLAAKLVDLNAPHIIILNEMRMLQMSFMDCESYGYESNETWASVNERIRREAEKEEAEHKKHMDGRPVDGCTFCEMGE